MLVLSSQEIEAICRDIDPVLAVREALILHAAGDTHLPAEAYLAWDAPRGGRARTLNMPGFVGGSINAIGTKIINGNPRNIEHDLPRASGLTLLFDANTARVTCLLDAAFISALRTAAVSFLCVEKLHLPVPVHLGVCGAGYLAQHHILLLAARCQVDEISIYDINHERSEKLRDYLKSCGIRVPIILPNSIEELASKATCLIAATTTTTPYIRYNMIKSGAVLINISLDDFCSDVFMKADQLFVDDLSLISADEHRLLGRLIRDGEIVGPNDKASNDKGSKAARPISGTIGGLLSGAYSARVTKHDIILVNPFGMAIEDVAVAQAIYREALEKGVGLRLMEDN